MNSLNTDYLYKNKINNINNNTNNLYCNNINEINQMFFPKVSSEYSLNLNDDNKKIINDNNKIFDWNENLCNSGDINYPKFGIFRNSSFNNLSNPEPLFNIKNIPSKSFSNGMNRVPSFGNINNYNSFNNLNNLSNINLTPHKNLLLDMYLPSNFHSVSNLNQMNNKNVNSLNNSNTNLFGNSKNNLLKLNSDNLTKGTLLTPPPQISFTLGQPPIIPVMKEKNKINFNYVNSLDDNMSSNENEKNSYTLNMFNKKRKRGVKNKKFVFILGDNKKEKKENENERNINNNNNKNNSENTDTPNQTQTNNFESNDACSDKSKKPRGSKFRGVSRNGNQWQVLIMVNKKKRYVGSYSKEEDAARAYDKVALQNHGTKAKTNFDYTKQEVENILASPQLLKL